MEILFISTNGDEKTYLVGECGSPFMFTFVL